MTTTVTTALRPAASRQTHDTSSSGVTLALLIAAVVPAVFWTAVVAGASPLLGYEPSASGLLTLALVIAGFLGCVVAMLHQSRD